MIQLSLSPSTTAPKTPDPVAPTAAPGGFSVTLADFLGLADGDETDTPPESVTVPTERQDAASDGKDLPVTADTDDDDSDRIDPGFAWLPIAFPPPLNKIHPIVFTPSGPATVSSAPIAAMPITVDTPMQPADMPIDPLVAPDDARSPAAGASDPIVEPEPSRGSGKPLDGPVHQSPLLHVPISTLPSRAPTVPSQTVPPRPVVSHILQPVASAAPVDATLVAAGGSTSPRPDGTQPNALSPSVAQSDPVTSQGKTGTVQPAAPPQAIQPVINPAQPAAQIFAAAIVAAQGQPEDRKPGKLVADILAPTPIGTSQGSATHTIVQPTGQVQHLPLDMRRDDWMQGMVDRIEALRDSADANDTRIRLVPDALGKIDVSLRKDGDTTHVHFTADVPATRVLLHDAQPRLAELAQARGLRLGQSAVDAGATGGDAQRQPDTPQSAISATPVSAAAAETPEDDRLA